MKTLGTSPLPCGTAIAVLLSAVGAFCLFVAVMVTFHAAEDGNMLNQKLSLTLRWFEQIFDADGHGSSQEKLDLQPSVESSHRRQ